MPGVVNYVEPFFGSGAVLLACPGWGEAMTAPFPYFGGKSRAAALVWERFGPALPRVETVNDINGFVANFWRAVAIDSEAVARWASWPVNETDLHARHKWLLKMLPLLKVRLDADPMYFDARIAGWWVWGASAWIGSGWCEEGSEPNPRRLPSIGGMVPEGETRNSGGGRGIHGAKMRAPSQRLPDLAGGTQWGTDEANARAGRGVHSARARGPGRQLPDLIGDGSGTQIGHGIHGKAIRTRLHDLFAALSGRLRYVRVACGDFERILTDAVTHRHGLTGVFLDPPYAGFEGVYGGSEAVSIRAFRWAREAGKRPDMRIALCGYEGEHDALVTDGWESVAWKAKGGYANAGSKENKNRHRERILFSPACLRPGRDVGQFSFPGVL